MPNLFAYVILLAWPAVVIILFRQFPLHKAMIWSILGGFLLLPMRTAIDLPVIPALDKVLIPSLAAFVMCALTARKPSVSAPHGVASLQGWLPRNPVVFVLASVFLLSPIGTGLFNLFPTLSGSKELSALSLYDAGSLVAINGILLIPFLLGRKYLTDPAQHSLLLRCLMVAAVLYTIPVFVELVLSPQLHRWIYGFFPHSFAQTVRYGGFRPVVFLGHGLMVSIFLAIGLMALLGVIRLSKGGAKVLYLALAAWVLLILILSKSVAPVIYVLILAPVLLFGRRTIFRVIIVSAATLTILYPALRGADIFPTETLIEAAEEIDPSRAHSLSFRFQNEDLLLERASEQPIFGWGKWGRNRIYNDFGRDIAPTDGQWVILIGVLGWVGYISQFGLLTAALFLLAAGRRTSVVSFPTAALAILLSVNLIDLLPNSSLTPLTWLIAGALVGYAEKRSTSRAVAPVVGRPPIRTQSPVALGRAAR